MGKTMYNKFRKQFVNDPNRVYWMSNKQYRIDNDCLIVGDYTGAAVEVANREEIKEQYPFILWANEDYSAEVPYIDIDEFIDYLEQNDDNFDYWHSFLEELERLEDYPSLNDDRVTVIEMEAKQEFIDDNFNDWLRDNFDDSTQSLMGRDMHDIITMDYSEAIYKYAIIETGLNVRIHDRDLPNVDNYGQVIANNVREYLSSKMSYSFLGSLVNDKLPDILDSMPLDNIKSIVNQILPSTRQYLIDILEGK